MLGSWLEEYDELESDAEGANYQTFQLNLQRWLDFIDDHPFISLYVASWESAVDFDAWYGAAQRSVGGTIGSGRLNWPREPKARLGLQFGLFRSLASGQIPIHDFALQFLFTESNFNAMVGQIAQQVFHPFARELRRTVQKLDLTNPPAPDEAFIPASDRVVALDHNSAEYHDLSEGLKSIGEQIGRINDYPNPAAQERHVAEISAGQRLLKSSKVRAAAVWAVLGPILTWIAVKFAESGVGALAKAMWKLLANVLSLSV